MIATGMSAITAFAAWFAENAAIRTLAGVLFFTLFGFALKRLAGKLSVTLFVLLGVGFGALFILSPAVHLLAIIALLMWLAAYEVRRSSLRRPYEPAVTVVESGGIKRGLTPPEAAVLLEMPVSTAIAVTLLGLLRKGALVVRQQAPLVLVIVPALRVEAASPAEQADQRRRAAQGLGIILQPYEEPFLTQIEAQAGEAVRSLNLVAPTRALLRYTARRFVGHNLPETMTYYRQHLGRARHDVAHFGEGPNGQKVRDHHFEWLLLDDSFAALYGDAHPAWLGQTGVEGESLENWVARLQEESAAAVSPESLQVRDATGRRFSLGGRDQITSDFFAAVAESVR